MTICNFIEIDDILCCVKYLVYSYRVYWRKHEYSNSSKYNKCQNTRQASEFKLVELFKSYFTSGIIFVMPLGWEIYYSKLKMVVNKYLICKYKLLLGWMPIVRPLFTNWFWLRIAIFTCARYWTHGRCDQLTGDVFRGSLNYIFL